MDKISAFEERLKRARSSVLFPNILGAKMRDVYELEKKRQEPQEEGEELELPSSWCVWYYFLPVCRFDFDVFIVLLSTYLLIELLPRNVLWRRGKLRIFRPPSRKAAWQTAWEGLSFCPRRVYTSCRV